MSPVLVCFSSRTPPSSSVMYLCNCGAWRSHASFPVDSRITPSTFRSSGSTTHYITQIIQQVAPPYSLTRSRWRHHTVLHAADGGTIQSYTQQMAAPYSLKLYSMWFRHLNPIEIAHPSCCIGGSKGEIIGTPPRSNFFHFHEVFHENLAKSSPLGNPGSAAVLSTNWVSRYYVKSANVAFPLKFDWGYVTYVSSQTVPRGCCVA